ncbi:glutamine--fructose-6-phosphate transaminase (isomerizing) [Gordonibacter massiliensis (ex Traore et al. 2017)]|uniref:Glutamine--fructose-6-phosphate aminotransferase [isomerizing] n=1 Tax=Gordonibacter massiliensis (ex Traore et al. 2017) TaxID=1841863 RepID=A0A842JC88_9ACTN|nr:glutamine--fructose-6-phosphate transaminase (isomerizing) [Gordonibacter massiliensis (ex Traore et al. 2017)]MBC2889084.1 glutamine--fructose-6-phosphate transaminase (isomerizing) [Gordonibacter massiliensis (ex Traore et al. 2017)]
MCGIVGYTGGRPAQDILIEGLRRLEYRGYDSAGIAVEQGGKLEVVHRKGKVGGLAETVANLAIAGTCGIGHTRWATHGKPSERNAHPHTSCGGHIAVVHNGIIENYAELRDELASRGHEFTSDTDTEVVAHLVEEAYVDDLLQAVREAAARLVGAYALAVVCDAEPGVIVAMRKDSPLVVGQGADGAYVASDMIALIDATRDVVVLGDGEAAKLTPEGIRYFSAFGEEIYEPKVTHVDWDVDLAEKGGYPDFMLKEIHEQPRVIRDTLAGRLVDGHLAIDELDLSHEELNLIDRVYVIACGTSYHAGLIAKNLIEGWARIPTEVEVASEFRYRNPIITPSTLVVAVSQSGETADTLAAIRDARVKGAKVFGITNVVGSPVARESDGVIYTKANKEIAVASTKSFLGQVVSLTLLALLLAQSKGKLTTNQVRLLFRELADTAEQVEVILSDTAAIDEAALACKDAASALFIGRGMGAAISKEGALKLKEISYLHAEAYPAGEMKHGPIALLDDGFPVIAIATQSPVYDKLVSNLQESKARGAMVVAVATEGDEDIKQHADHVIYIPKVRDAFSAITASVPLQLFARSIAVARGCDVDQPRNLAKSVTVE